MPIPVAALAIPAGIQLASSIAQWFNSREAQQASADERARMEELLAKVQDPQFDVSDITPEEYSVVQQYKPEIANFIEEQAPQRLSQTADMQQGRQAQLSALDRLMQQSQGRDEAFDIDQQRAMRDQANASASARRTAMDQGQRQGMAPSQMGYANALQGMSDAQMRGAMMGEEGVRQQALRRNEALAQGATLGGNLWNQDMSMQEKNANIMNEFNQRLAQSRQNWENARAGTMNQAQQYNIGAAQDVANRNVGGRNAAALGNRNYRNTVAQDVYDNQLKKLGVQGQQSAQASQAARDLAAQQNQTISGIAGAGTNIAAYYGADDERQRQADADYWKGKGKYTPKYDANGNYIKEDI